MRKLFLTLLVLSSSLFTLNAQSWLWARQGRNGGTRIYNSCLSVAEDNLHNVYETGFYSKDTLILQNDTLFALAGTGEQAFLAKYDENGSFLWAQQSATSANGYGQSYHVTTDEQNNVYIAGLFKDNISFQSYYLQSPPRATCDMFFVKYNPNGNVLWAKQSKSLDIYAASAVEVHGSATDNYGNTYITGLFTDTVSFGPDTLSNNGYSAFFLAKYNSSGNLKWIKHANNISHSAGSGGSSVTIDNSGNIYATGSFVDTIAFGSVTLPCQNYNDNVFIVKYDTGGNVIWAKQTSTPSSFSSGAGGGICTDINGNIYISGRFWDTLYIGATTLINPNNEWYDVFWAKYDSSGNVLWAKQAYPMENPPVQWASTSIVTDYAKNLYLGAFSGIQNIAISQQAKAIFGNDTLQLAKVKSAYVLVKFDSSGSNVMSASIFPTGGQSDYDPFVIDSSGCYGYLGGTTYDTTAIFANDTVGTDTVTFWTFVARWDCGDITSANNVIAQKFSVNLYPDPNEGKFTLTVSHAELVSASQLTLEIYNMLGEKVYGGILRSAQGDNLITLTNQPNGVYFYRVINEQEGLIASGKFIIQ